MSSISVSIQPGTQSDVQHISRIMQANPDVPQWTQAQVQAIFRQGHAGVCRVALLAMQGAQVTGFAVVAAVSGTDVHEAELESIAVDPESKRQGVGRALLENVLQWALLRGAACLRLEVRQSNVAALALYRDCGFVWMGIRPRYYTHPLEDAVLMERMLGAG